MSAAGNWSEESSGNFCEKLVTTYVGGSIALECGIMNLHIGTRVGINGSTLEVACPPPGIGAKKNQETFEARFGTTYIASGSVAQMCYRKSPRCLQLRK